MSVVQALRELVFGETWILPLGLGSELVAALLIRAALGDRWEHVGGFALLAGVALLLVVSVWATGSSEATAPRQDDADAP